MIYIYIYAHRANAWEICGSQDDWNRYIGRAPSIYLYGRICIHNGPHISHKRLLCWGQSDVAVRSIKNLHIDAVSDAFSTLGGKDDELLLVRNISGTHDAHILCGWACGYTISRTDVDDTQTHTHLYVFDICNYAYACRIWNCPQNMLGGLKILLKLYYLWLMLDTKSSYNICG